MIGSFLTRALALVLGYAYPAYECFKTVELNRPEIEQLRFWCQYWILVAALTVFERVGESFISWLPMYSEAKLAFFVYLWYPKTKGTSYVYETFFKPVVAKHETEIDRNLVELRTRAGDMIVFYSQKAVSYGQTRIFEILQYVAAQSPSQSSRTRATQAHQQPQPPSRSSIPSSTTNPPQLLKQPPQPPKQLPPTSPKKLQHQEPQISTAAPLSSSTSSQPPLQNIIQSSSNDASSSSNLPSENEAMQIETATSDDATSNNKGKQITDPLLPPVQETPMEEAIRMTRGRLRKRAASLATP